MIASRGELPRDFSVLLNVTARVKSDQEFQTAVDEIWGPETVSRRLALVVVEETCGPEAIDNLAG